MTSNHAEGAECIEGGLLDRTLMVAKRKVQRAMVVSAAVAVPAVGVVFLAIFSKHGTEAPLFLFSAPFNVSPLIWMCFNVQLHSGRSNQSRVGSQQRVNMHSPARVAVIN